MGPCIRILLLLATVNVSASLAWMSGLDGELYLSQLSIPGTHDSAATRQYASSCRDWNFCVCQSMTLVEQLDAGIRFFDIRLRHIEDNFAIHHGRVFLNRYFNQVMADFRSFLANNKEEVIIMSYQKAHTEEDTTRSFAETLQVFLDKDADIIYSGSSIPKLKDVRGKIVLVNFGDNGNLDQGLYKRTSERPNGAFTSASVENDWTPYCRKNPFKSCNNYIQSLKNNMDEANRAKSTSTMFITYTSATAELPMDPSSPRGYSQLVNPKMIDFFASKSKPYTAGCVVMDFPSKDLIQAIISKN